MDDVKQIDPTEKSNLKFFVDVLPLAARQKIEHWGGMPAEVADEHGNPTHYVVGRAGRSEVTMILLDRLAGPPRNQRLERIALIVAREGRGRRQPQQAEVNDLIQAYADMQEIERDSDGEEVIVYGTPRVAAGVGLGR